MPEVVRAKRACSSCAERDAEITRLKRALAERAKALVPMKRYVATDFRGGVDRKAGLREGHGARCQCIGCRAGR